MKSINKEREIKMAETGKIEILKKLAALIRYFILASTTEAGSGHPTSSLSATDLMTALLFGGFFRYDP
jgi:transketolase